MPAGGCTRRVWNSAASGTAGCGFRLSARRSGDHATTVAEHTNSHLPVAKLGVRRFQLPIRSTIMSLSLAKRFRPVTKLGHGRFRFDCKLSISNLCRGLLSKNFEIPLDAAQRYSSIVLARQPHRAIILLGKRTTPYGLVDTQAK